MKTFLACAGIYGSNAALNKLIQVANERNPDAILFAGGITGMDSNPFQKTAFIGKFFETLGKINKFAVVIPGPNDAPLWEFLRAAVSSEITSPNVAVAHATVVTNGQVAAGGIGGLITESEDVGAPLIKHSHAAVEYFLRGLWKTRKSIKVLLLSELPPGKLAGNEGKGVVGELILTHHPAICVAPGKKKNRGFEQEAHGFVINPGLLSEGSAAWVDWVNRKVEMLDL
ncbi:MAG: hypothetical protein HYX81_05530 [Chloroflexi bacterium]|nr:hypothetical protein [Chloroflexota bacterium]